MTETNHEIQEGKEKMKEREIDLLDMIADILSHWRGLLIAVVLGAILMGAFSYEILSECTEYAATGGRRCI